MWKLVLTAIVGAVVLPNAVAAQETPSGIYGPSGIYVEARGGAVFLMDSDLEDGLPAGTELDVEFDPGWMAEGAIGYAHESGFRGEVAAGYRKNDFDEVKLSVAGVGSASAGAGGDITATTVMANVYYDAWFGPQRRWVLAVGQEQHISISVASASVASPSVAMTTPSLPIKAPQVFRSLPLRMSCSVWATSTWRRRTRSSVELTPNTKPTTPLLGRVSCSRARIGVEAPSSRDSALPRRGFSLG